MIASIVSDSVRKQTIFQDFHIAKRDQWNGLDADLRTRLIKDGEEVLSFEWPFLTLSMFQEFSKSGDRERYQKPYFEKRRVLIALVLAECVENKGRFLNAIEEGFWSIISENSWVLPAHNTYVRDTPTWVVPLSERSLLDLFACETGALLSLAIQLLEGAIHPHVRLMVSDQVERRIIRPYLGKEFWWMGLHGEQLNNWTTWCTQNILLTAFTMDIEQADLQAVVTKSTKSLEAWLGQYGEDGCCDEGPSYWHHAGVCFWGSLHLLSEGTGIGFERIFSQKKIQNIAAYIMNVHIEDDLYINFADSSPKAGKLGVREYLFAKEVKNPVLMRQALLDYRSNPFEKMDNDYNLFYRVLALAYHKELTTCALHNEQPKPPYVWYPSVGVALYRRGPFTLAVKGGDNDDSHNHNDTGSLILYAGKKPLLIDVGVGTYTRTTFSEHRYTIWTMQSDYHSVVNFPPVSQEAGSAFKAKLLYVDHKKIVLELKDAYPKTSELVSYLRRVTINEKSVTVTEVVEGSRVPHLTLMSVDRPRSQDLNLQYGSWKISLEGAIDSVVERLEIDDPRLQEVWPTNLYRTRVTFDKDLTWRVELT